MKVLLVTSGKGLAHKSRIVEVAKTLSENGINAIVATNYIPEFLDPKDVRFLHHEQSYAGFLQFGFLPVVDLQGLEKTIELEIELLRREKPDLIITDLSFPTKIAAANCGIPHYNIANYGDQIVNVPIRFGEGSFLYYAANRLNEMSRGRFMEMLKRFAIGKMNGIANQMADKFHAGLSFEGNDLFLGNQYTFFADAPQLFRDPTTHHHSSFVGPIFWDCRATKTSKPETKTDLAYLTMGSSGYRTYMGMLAKVLSSEGFVVTVSTGGAFVDFDEEGVRVRDFVDSNSVLARANLMVFNGSALSMYQAIMHRVPVIAIPKNISQSFYADVAESNGIGRRLDLFGLTERKLRGAIQELGENLAYKHNLHDLATKIGNFNGTQQIVDKVKKV